MKLPFVSRKRYEVLAEQAIDAIGTLALEKEKLRQELEKYKTPRDEKGRFVKR